MIDVAIHTRRSLSQMLIGKSCKYMVPYTPTCYVGTDGDVGTFTVFRHSI